MTNEAERSLRVYVSDLEAERDALREALQKIAAYWEPHSGVNDIFDSIAEISRAALERHP